MSDTLRLGTRGSRLALWQADHIKGLLEKAHPGLTVEQVVIRTSGDRLTGALTASRGIGFFTKEIEQALLDGRVDVAVHSLKDLPTVLADGLCLAAVPAREDARDAVVGRPGVVDSLADLVPGVKVATSSPRREGQLNHAFPEIEVVPLRGNVPTRVAQVTEEGGPDAVVLALAGLRRLGLTDHVTAILPYDQMLPAAGQGALGIETREDDACARELLAALDDADVRTAVAAERAFLRRLEGGCTIPAGALCVIDEDGEIQLTGLVVSLSGHNHIQGEHTGARDEAESVGEGLAEAILEKGGREILQDLRGYSE